MPGWLSELSQSLELWPQSKGTPSSIVAGHSLSAPPATPMVLSNLQHAQEAWDC